MGTGKGSNVGTAVGIDVGGIDGAEVGIAVGTGVGTGVGVCVSQLTPVACAFAIERRRTDAVAWTDEGVERRRPVATD